MANNTTKKAGSNKSFIDRMGGQKFIVLLVVIALFIFFCAMSPNFRKSQLLHRQAFHQPSYYQKLQMM